MCVLLQISVAAILPNISRSVKNRRSNRKNKKGPRFLKHSVVPGDTKKTEDANKLVLQRAFLTLRQHDIVARINTLDQPQSAA